jgi:hypothetical protein
VLSLASWLSSQSAEVRNSGGWTVVMGRWVKMSNRGFLGAWRCLFGAFVLKCQHNWFFTVIVRALNAFVAR